MQVWLVNHYTGNNGFVEEVLAFSSKQKAKDYIRKMRDLAIEYDVLVEDRLNWGVPAVWATDEDGLEHSFVLDPVAKTVQ